MKPVFYLFLKLGPKNVFVNIFKNRKGKRTPLLSRTLNSANYIKKEYHPNLTTLNEFIETLAEWIKLKKPAKAKLIVVFNDFGVKFRKKAQSASPGIYKKRKTFMKIFRRERIAISQLVDATSIPYNGCLQKKKRRKKKKGFKKHDKI